MAAKRKRRRLRDQNLVVLRKLKSNRVQSRKRYRRRSRKPHDQG